MNLWNFKEWFYHDAIHINTFKDQNIQKLVFNTFTSIKEPIIQLSNSPSLRT